jgi:hypothetical protein
MRTVLSLLVLVGLCFSQSNLNWKGWDTAQIVTFKADTLRLTKTFVSSNGENKALVVIADDTSNAGRNLDSIKFHFGYQLGYPVKGLTGVDDTAWTNGIPLDTFDMRTAGNYYHPDKLTGSAIWTLDATTDMPVRKHLQVDTSMTALGSAMVVPFTPYWSPYIRFFLKGLTLNKVTQFLLVRVVFEQRGYINVRQY